MPLVTAKAEYPSTRKCTLSDIVYHNQSSLNKVAGATPEIEVKGKRFGCNSHFPASPMIAPRNNPACTENSTQACVAIDDSRLDGWTFRVANEITAATQPTTMERNSASLVHLGGKRKRVSSRSLANLNCSKITPLIPTKAVAATTMASKYASLCTGNIVPLGYRYVKTV